MLICICSIIRVLIKRIKETILGEGEFTFCKDGKSRFKVKPITIREKNLKLNSKVYYEAENKGYCPKATKRSKNKSKVLSEIKGLLRNSKEGIL
jgi:hypothetical protein